MINPKVCNFLWKQQFFSKGSAQASLSYASQEELALIGYCAGAFMPRDLAVASNEIFVIGRVRWSVNTFVS